MELAALPAKPIRWGRRLAGLALLGVLILLGTCAYPFLRGEWSYRQLDKEYARRKSQYDAIVQRLSTQAITSDRMEHFFIGPDRNPANLRKLGPDELDGVRYEFHKQACLISAYREPDGSLVVFFVVRDFGTMQGTQGLVYSAAPPRPGQFGLGGRHNKVGVNWWAIWT